MAEDRSVSEENRKRIKKMLKDRAPATRKRSAQFVFWEDVGTKLGQPFNFTNIPLSKLYEMQRDPTLAFAMHYARVPILRAPWRIEGTDAQVNAFIENALKEIYPSFVLDYLNSWNFGYQGIVKRFKLANPEWTYIDPTSEDQEEKKVWDYGTVQAVVWDTFVPLPPELCEPDWNKKGEFNGIIYEGTPGEGIFPFEATEEDEVKIDLEHSLWVTNEKESVFGSVYGYPRLGYAYPYWWSFWFRWALADRAFEKSVDPAMVVRFPDDIGVLDEDGEQIDPREIAFQLGEAARSNDTVALPSTLQIDQSAEGRSTGMYEWDLEQIESNVNFEALRSTFEQLEVQKIQAVWVPEHSLTSGTGDQSSRNVAAEMTSSLKESQAVTMSEIDEHINKYMIPQLIEVNFPEKKNITCKKITTGFASNDIELSKALVQLLGQQDAGKLPVNIKQILEEAGVPVLTPQQIKQEEEKALEDAQKMQEIQNPPEQLNGIPGPESGASSEWGSKQDIGFEELLNVLADKNINFELTDLQDTGVSAFYQDDTLYLSEALSEEDRVFNIKRMLKALDE